MRIAIVDYKIIQANPIGSCHLALLRELCHEQDFTVFAVEFENPCPDRIPWVKIPAISRPLILLYISFHLLAPLWFLVFRLRSGKAFDLIQMVESNLSFGDISYAHFCHRFYLRNCWLVGKAGGLRVALRWLDHKAHALLEPFVFQKVDRIIVPSRGLGEELSHEFPDVAGKVQVISNPVDVLSFRQPDDFDRIAARCSLGANPQERLLVFVALGHFERKGLPQLLDALKLQARIAGDHPLRLVVVGGEESLISVYKSDCAARGIASQVTFTGMQSDVRRFLWAADAFILPSSYETFSLVAFQAAAAGLPLIVTKLHGVQQILRNGENGILIQNTVEDIAKALQQFRSMGQDALLQMGRKAQKDVQSYGIADFATAWRSFYRSVEARTESPLRVSEISMKGAPE